MKTALWAVLALALSAPGALANDDTARKELLSGGALRVGIGVAPVSSAFWATKDASGNPKGVTVDLGAALAKKLGVPVEYKIYNSSGDVTEAGAKAEWDVSFMPYDGERAKKVVFGSSYYEFVSTYLVPAGSPIKTIDEVDRAGVKVAGVANTTTIRSAERALKTATVVGFKSVDEILEKLKAGEVQAVGLGKESLESLVPKLPGARILDGHFHATAVAVAVPPGRKAALDYVSAFVEEAKSSGVVRKALDASGINGPVAPAGSKP
jgi:polar amino acid transport system substrate-binding protein